MCTFTGCCDLNVCVNWPLLMKLPNVLRQQGQQSFQQFIPTKLRFASKKPRNRMSLNEDLNVGINCARNAAASCLACKSAA